MKRRRACMFWTEKKLEHAKPDLKILHPLPRVDEITEGVDYDPRATYFRQTVYGMYARMALILTILRGSQISAEQTDQLLPRIRASAPIRTASRRRNRICRTCFTEAGGMLTCSYCDGRTLI